MYPFEHYMFEGAISSGEGYGDFEKREKAAGRRQPCEYQPVFDYDDLNYDDRNDDDDDDDVEDNHVST